MPPSSGVNILVRVRPMLARELAFDNAVELLSVSTPLPACLHLMHAQQQQQQLILL